MSGLKRFPSPDVYVKAALPFWDRSFGVGWSQKREREDRESVFFGEIIIKQWRKRLCCKNDDGPVDLGLFW
jgi:hypothetical protein